ncbi:MAG: alpha-galactosidase [Solirubrobacterales bacterium]
MKQPTIWMVTTIVCFAVTKLPAASSAAQNARAEMQRTEQWVQRFAPLSQTKTPSQDAAVPFSFTLGSQSSSASWSSWAVTSDSEEFTASSLRRSASWRDQKTGVQVTAEVVRFHDFPAVEWVLRFKNQGATDSPILEQVLPLDLRLPPGGLGEQTPVLHYAKGALCCLDDFSPVDTPLTPGTDLHLQPGGGRSSSEVLPFFNLDGGNRGIVFGVGWTGEWAVNVKADERGELSIQAGMANTHLTLHPGEEIRTPRILVLCWEGDRMRGNNLLRRFLLAHHRPSPGGKPLVLPVLVGSWGGSSASEHMQTINRIVASNLPVELYWIDAEWFGGAPWYSNAGNWDVRKDLYPQGFRPLSDVLHASRRKLLLWFEAQRVCAGTPWARFRDRPGWLLELKNGNPDYQQRQMNWGIPHEDPQWIVRESHRSQICEGDMLWNMGQPNARRFMTNWLSARIVEFGLDWYREDFNIAPLEYWLEADAPDRVGMTEIRYVEGLYAMWDELLRRHPNLAIDNCASGGRRIDLETIGRATALWRTDWPVDAIHRQCHTFGLMQWVPLHMSEGVTLTAGNEYELRSAMTAGLNVKLPPQIDEASLRQAKAMIEQYQSIQKYFYGDFYPLTPYSQASDTWLAYQLHLPDTNEGIAVILKRPASTCTKATLRLYGMVNGATYEVTNLDKGRSERRTAEQLIDQGLDIELPRQPDSAILQYRRLAAP